MINIPCFNLTRKNKINIDFDTIDSAIAKKSNNKSLSKKSLKKLEAIVKKDFDFKYEESHFVFCGKRGFFDKVSQLSGLEGKKTKLLYESLSKLEFTHKDDPIINNIMDFKERTACLHRLDNIFNILRRGGVIKLNMHANNIEKMAIYRNYVDRKDNYGMNNRLDIMVYGTGGQRWNL